MSYLVLSPQKRRRASVIGVNTTEREKESAWMEMRERDVSQVRRE